MLRNILTLLVLSVSMICNASPIYKDIFSGGDGLTSKWVVEAQDQNTSIEVDGQSVEIVSPRGLTLWYDNLFEGDYQISYSVKLVMEGGEYDRLSDLNCFWGAVDPESPNNIYERGEWRGGSFPLYRTLNLFYAGYGGNKNSSTRFRRYYSEHYQSNDNEKIRPVIKEYCEPEDLLKPNIWMRVVITVKDGRTTYSMDGKELFNHPLEEGQDRGYFGLRLLHNHTIFKDFLVEEF